MPRKGRGTELVLKELESLSLKDQAKIKSPDYIYDVVTGKDREVDVSIRIKIGTHEFLTIIECRDRKGNEDVTWIEQIVTKTKNLQANKVIAVSTSGFTDGAKKLAAHENVILRTLRDFKADEAIDWLDSLILRESKWNMLHMGINCINVELDDPTKKEFGKIEIKDFDPLEKNIKVASSGEYVNFEDIINSVNKENNNFLFDDINDNEPPVIKKALLKFDLDNKHLIEIEDKTFYIDTIAIECECWIEAKKIPFKKALKYEENEKSVLDNVNYEFLTTDGKKVFFTIAKDHNASTVFFKGHYKDPKNNKIQRTTSL